MDNYILESKKLIWYFVKFEKSSKRVKSPIQFYGKLAF